MTNQYWQIELFKHARLPGDVEGYFRSIFWEKATPLTTTSSTHLLHASKDVPVNCLIMEAGIKFALLLVFLVYVHRTACTHFRGGSFTYKPVNSSNHASMKVRVAFSNTHLFDVRTPNMNSSSLETAFSNSAFPCKPLMSQLTKRSNVTDDSRNYAEFLQGRNQITWGSTYSIFSDHIILTLGMRRSDDVVAQWRIMTPFSRNWNIVHA